jgi:predicted Holliday junction resolvase-like endonuclease
MTSLILLKKHAFLLLSILLFIIITVQNNHIKSLKLEISVRDNELTIIENQAKQYSQKLLKAQEQYKKSIKKSKISAERILNEHVSDDCNSSIKWLRDQSIYFPLESQ